MGNYIFLNFRIDLPSPSISMGKSEKDKLNKKERRINRILRSSEKEALQYRANSIKRAIYNVVEHSEPGRPKRYQRRFSVSPFEAIKVTAMVSSTETSPCTSPLPVPPINVISPSVSTTRLTCISPFPDMKRDSVDENFLTTISLPVPTQFADGSSRRSSGIPEVIQEIDENGIRTSLSIDGNKRDDSDVKTPDSKASSSTITERKIDFLSVPIITAEHCIDPLSDLRPIEVFERNLYGLLVEKSSKESTEKSEVKKEEKENKENEETPVASQNTESTGIKGDNVYTSENITIIDTDPPVNIFEL